MTDSEFDQVVADVCAGIVKVLQSKAKEYARGDRLHNFKRAAAMDGETPEKALKGMWKKHVISVCDMVNDLDDGKVAPLAMWDEKIGDAINYLVLLKGLVTERIGR